MTAKPQNQNQAPRFIRIRQVKERTTLSRSTIYNKIMKGEFPEPITLGSKTVVWSEQAIEDWMAKQAAAGWISKGWHGKNSRSWRQNETPNAAATA